MLLILKARERLKIRIDLSFTWLSIWWLIRYRVASFIKRVNSVFPEVIKTIRGEVSVLLSLITNN